MKKVIFDSINSFTKTTMHWMIFINQQMEWIGLTNGIRLLDVVVIVTNKIINFQLIVMDLFANHFKLLDCKLHYFNILSCIIFCFDYSFCISFNSNKELEQQSTFRNYSKFHFKSCFTSIIVNILHFMSNFKLNDNK